MNDVIGSSGNHGFAMGLKKFCRPGPGTALIGCPRGPCADFYVLVTGLAEQLQTAAWASVYPSIIDAAERDPEIAAMQSELHKGFMEPFHAVVERARDRGEISPAKRLPTSSRR